jgi:hypothetical protein
MSEVLANSSAIPRLEYPDDLAGAAELFASTSLISLITS